MIKLKCSFETGIGRFDPSDYVRTIYIDVVFRDEYEQEFVLGKVCVDQARISAAQNDGQSLIHIFDVDSQGLLDAFGALFRTDGELQEELGADAATHNLIFLWKAIFHPAIQPYVCGIVDAIGGLFGEFSVFATWHKTTGLSDADLVELGFKKISGSRLIFRHLGFLTPFNRQNPQGLEGPYDFQCSEDQEKWVLANWEDDRM